MFLVLVFLQEDPQALRNATAGVNFEANNVRRYNPYVVLLTSVELPKR